MSLKNAQGAPIVAAIIVLVAVLALGMVSFAFQGSIQF
jgi:hypothetical protein